MVFCSLHKIILTDLQIAMKRIVLFLTAAIVMLSGVSAQEDKASEFNHLKAKAERGDAEAQYRLGHCYSNGDVVPKDEKKAVVWFRKAANQGHAGAQNQLGMAYYYGLGVDSDKKKAVFWYRKAANQGHDWAQYWLAGCYHNGMGVPKDIEKAKYWARKSAAQGHKYAKKILEVYERE